MSKAGRSGHCCATRCADSARRRVPFRCSTTRWRACWRAPRSRRQFSRPIGVIVGTGTNMAGILPGRRDHETRRAAGLARRRGDGGQSRIRRFQPARNSNVVGRCARRVAAARSAQPPAFRESRQRRLSAAPVARGRGRRCLREGGFRSRRPEGRCRHGGAIARRRDAGRSRDLAGRPLRRSDCRRAGGAARRLSRHRTWRGAHRHSGRRHAVPQNAGLSRARGVAPARTGAAHRGGVHPE